MKFNKIFFILAVTLSSLLKCEHRRLIVLNEPGINENFAMTLNAPNEYKYIIPAGFGAISATLVCAIYEETAPIFVSKPLWDSVCKHRNLFLDFIKHDTNWLYNKYSCHTRFESSSSISEFKKLSEHSVKAYNKIKMLLAKNKNKESFEKALCEDLMFDKKNCPESIQNEDEMSIEESWRYILCFNLPIENFIIKECSNAYLFIPKKYLSKINPNSLSLNQALGLKVEKLPDVKNPFDPIKQNKKNISFLKEFLNLFVTNSKYKWTFYISGHGDFCQDSQESILKQKKALKKHKALYEKYKKKKAPKELLTKSETDIQNINKKISTLFNNQKICGFNCLEWKKLILEINKMPIHLLIYDSCSAGGQNAIDPYQNNKKSICLNYPILSTSLNETEVNFSIYPSPLCLYKNGKKLCNAPDYNELNKSKGLLTSTINFEQFFSKVETATTKEDFENCLNYISIWFDKPLDSKDKNGRIKRSFLGNIPTIRFAKECCFKPVKLKEVITFNKSNNNESCFINSNDKIACLLDTELINKSIEIEESSAPFPSFVSILPGKATHKISKINGRSYKLSRIIEAFFPFEPLYSTKVFFVKQLTAKDDILSYGNIKTLNNLFFMNNILDTNNERINCVIISKDYNYHMLIWPFEEKVPENITHSFEVVTQEEISELFEKNNLKLENFID